jgi:hypothetical protein
MFLHPFLTDLEDENSQGQLVSMRVRFLIFFLIFQLYDFFKRDFFEVMLSLLKKVLIFFVSTFPQKFVWRNKSFLLVPEDE